MGGEPLRMLKPRHLGRVILMDYLSLKTLRLEVRPEFRAP